MPSVRQPLHFALGRRSQAANKRERPAATPGAPQTTTADETKAATRVADRGDGPRS
jgi:hypothetical protein